MKRLITLMRPRQWIKNAFALAPLFFSLQMQQLESLMAALLACGAFIAVSSIAYIINDILDYEEDRKHPEKKKRPIAAGDITIPQALLLLIPLIAIVVICLILLPVGCTAIVLLYSSINILYSHWFKHVAIVDVIVIASGFVLRLLMGGIAIGVTLSSWIILSTFLLALFLGFGKRYKELSIIQYQDVRKSLKGYTLELLNAFILITCAASLLAYAIYTVETGRILESSTLVYTNLFVVFGLFRYLQSVYLNHEGGEPERIIIGDPIFLTNGVLWLMAVWWSLSYG